MSERPLPDPEPEPMPSPQPVPQPDPMPTPEPMPQPEPGPEPGPMPQGAIADIESHAALVTSVAGSRESELLDVLIEWIRLHHQQGGDFSSAAISAAGQAGMNALRSGFSLSDAFQSARNAYFEALDDGDAPASKSPHDLQSRQAVSQLSKEVS